MFEKVGCNALKNADGYWRSLGDEGISHGAGLVGEKSKLAYKVTMLLK